MLQTAVAEAGGKNDARRSGSERECRRDQLGVRAVRAIPGSAHLEEEPKALLIRSFWLFLVGGCCPL
jgi:hypothetical protein